MPEKLVWYPGRSRAADGLELERGRGSSKVQPSNKPSAPATKKKKAVPAIKETPLETSLVSHISYSTMERGEEASILDYSTLSTFSHGSDFSGWQDEELGTKCHAVGVDIPGLRSGMISRLDTRGSQQRRGEGNGYQFTHLLEAHEHMEHYRTHCCYTMLACASPQSSLVVPDLVDQGQQALFKLEVKSLYRGGDPFLRELASRLGVGDSIIREPQLLTSHRQTAPSIVKRPRNKTDLVIDLTPKPRSDEEEDDLCTLGAAWVVDNTKASHTSCPLELPRISEVPHKGNSSTISVNKYIRVNSHGEDGTVLPQVPTPGTQLSSTSDVTIEQFTESTPYERVEEIAHNKAQESPLIQNKSSVHTLNKAQKEKLISATAQLLGLSSREWAAPSTISRQLNRYPSRPTTQKQERTSKRSSDKQQQTRPTTRQETNKHQQARPATKTNKVVESRSPSRQQHHFVLTRPTTRQKQPQTKRPHSTLARHKEKLDRLKSIYSQSSTLSRPHTRLHTRHKEATERDTLDDSSYWNDLYVHTSHRKEARKNEQKGDSLSEVNTMSQQSKSLSGKVLKNRTKPIQTRPKEELTSRSSPLEIARHITRFKQKFDRVLNAHKHQISS